MSGLRAESASKTPASTNGSGGGRHDRRKLGVAVGGRVYDDITKYGYFYNYDDEEDGPDDEPSFDIGCRYEDYQDEHGKTQQRCIPLSRADALYPQEWDEFVVAPAHFDAITELANLAKHQFRDDPTSCVLSDTNVQTKLKEPELRPDLMILLNVVRQRGRSYGTFRYRKEPAPPRCPLVMEVTSPKTRKNDLEPERKLRIYDNAGVEQYVIVDLPKGETRPEGQVLNYLRTEAGLELQPKRPDGRVLLNGLNTEVGLQGDEIKLFEADTGADVPTYSQARDRELSAKNEAKQAKSEAKQAETKAKQAEEEIRLLKEQLARLKGTSPANGSGAASPQG